MTAVSELELLAQENRELKRKLQELSSGLSGASSAPAAFAARATDASSDPDGRFSTIFRAAGVGILLLDTKGCVLLANPAAAQILGTSQVDLLGTCAIELGKGDGVRFAEVLRGERDRYRIEHTFQRQDGSDVIVGLTVTRLSAEQAVALIDEVSARMGAEESAKRLLMEQAARAEAEAARRRVAFLAEAGVALASSLDWTATLEKLVRLAVPILGDLCLVEVEDPDGTVRRVTEAAVDPLSEAKLRAIPRTPSRNARQNLVLEVMRSGKTRLVASIDGRPLTEQDDSTNLERLGVAVFPTSLLIVPLIAVARTFGAIVFGTTQEGRPYSDSEVALAEEFARRAALAIYNARLYQDAKEASRLKDDFLAVVSHELRTPLMPILGWSQLLRDSKVTKDNLTNGLKTIERNARSQARLIDDLLDVSRIISGKLRIEVRALKLGPTIEDAVESMRPAAKAKGITLSLRLDTGAPRVMGDPTRLQQIVWNLVANAIKFTPSTGRVDVRLSGGTDKAVITVVDTGEGIRADFLPHLFERFRQAEAASTRKHGGLGLGLSIVRHLVELHGGTVAAHSNGSGMGSTFTVTLPMALEAPPEAALAPRLSERRAPQTHEKPLTLTRLDRLALLVVDDQPDTLEFLSRLLTDLGAGVQTASSASLALTQIRKARPDVLISDIGMPVEDGYALIQKIRALAPTDGGAIPSIALTAFARADDRVRALQAGFQMHVPKPVDPAELSAVIASLARRETPVTGRTKPRKAPRKKP